MGADRASAGEGAGTRFGLDHLLAWLALGDDARLGDVTPHNPPFTSASMSDLPNASPVLRPGGLFVAVKGERRDGHDFVTSAFARGASAALVARVPENLADDVAAGRVAVVHAAAATSPPDPLSTGLERRNAVRNAGGPTLVVVDDPQTALQGCAAWWRRQLPVRVICITGSVGKTTTKDLAANVLQRRYRTLRTEGNLNNELGLPFMLLRLTADHERAVLEIGISDLGEMETFAAIAGPDVAVVTRVAPVHLHHFKDVGTVEREKGRLVEALHADSVAVLNADDPRVARMASRSPGRTVLFGESAAAEVRASDVHPLGLEGLGLTISRGGESCLVQAPLVGRHFVTATLAAAAVGLLEGCSWDDVVAGLEREVDSQRLKPRRLEGGAVLLDDAYNASPEACKAALDVLATAPGCRFAVLGDMFELGDYAEAGHKEVGRYVPGRADVLVTVGELGRVIAGAARGAGLAADAVHAFDGNAAAAEFLGARLGAGDSVLIKGSHGMRMDEIVRTLTGAA